MLRPLSPAAWASTTPGFLPTVALQVQQAGQVGWSRRKRAAAIDGRLGVESHTKPGNLQHAHIVCAIANRRNISQRQTAIGGQSGENRLLAGAVEYGFADRAGNFALSDLETVGAEFVEVTLSRHDCAAKESKPPETSTVQAPPARMVRTNRRAPAVGSINAATRSSKPTG